METNSENILLGKLSEGDKSAYETLFLRYNDRMVNFLVTLVRDREIARDMSQEIFAKIWEKREKMNSISNFSAYLFQMARFMVCDYFDHMSVTENYVEQVTAKYQVASGTDTEEYLFLEELKEIIDYAINTQLTGQQSRIYRMSREEGLSNEEISKLLGISKRTVENHISAALKVLQKAIYMILIAKYGEIF